MNTQAFTTFAEKFVLAVKRCPHCDALPALDPSFHGQFCVYCDNDDCPSRDQQAMAHTLESAVALWNERADERRSLASVQAMGRI